jgi:hypothetical protein
LWTCLVLNEPDECVTGDSNNDGDDSDNFEDYIAVADEEDSQMEEEGQGHSLRTGTRTVPLFGGGGTRKFIIGNVNTGGETQNPVCVIHYNKWMGGTDLKDQLLQMYLVERKCICKWYVKLFRRLLNAMIIYRHNNGEKINQLALRVNLVQTLFQQFANTQCKVPGRRAAENIFP